MDPVAAAARERVQGSVFHRLTQELIDEYVRIEKQHEFQRAEIRRLRDLLADSQHDLAIARSGDLEPIQNCGSDRSSRHCSNPFKAATPFPSWNSINGCAGRDELNGDRNGHCSGRPVALAITVGSEGGGKPCRRLASGHSSLSSDSPPPEPEAPPSPRSPPQSPMRVVRKAARQITWEGPKIDLMTSEGDRISELSPRCDTYQDGDENGIGRANEEDFGRMSGLSLVSKDSRASTSQGSQPAMLDDLNRLIVLVVWKATRSNSKARMSAQRSSGTPMSKPEMAQLQSYVEVSESEAKYGVVLEFLQPCVLAPDSRLSTIWDLLTAIMLCYDLVAIPLLAYDLPPSIAWDIVEIFITSMWTLDIFFTFFRGIEKGGSVEMKVDRIAYHYVRTWFAFDACIVLIDWVLWGVSSGNVMDMLRISRIRRLLRFFRLARLLKHGRRMMSFLKNEYESARVIIRIIWLLLILVIINHFVSCAWYAIGALGMYEGCWTNRFAEDDTFAYKYATSFHWSVTQFTPASMEVVPSNVLERCYNIVIIFFGLLMFSSFVSSMTNSMTYLQKINNEKHEQRMMVKQYITDRRLSHQLGASIVHHVRRATGQRRGLVESDIPCLRSLPREMREQLRVEVFSQWLKVHLLFKTLFANEPGICMALCQSSMLEKALAPGDELFRFGLRCSHMYFVIKGSVTYVFGYEELEQAPAEVGIRQWMSEPALWVKWDHRGRAYANCSTACDLVVLVASEFHTLFANCSSRFQLQHYARLYAWRAECDNGGGDFVSDVWGQRPRVAELVNQVFEIDCDVEAQKMIFLMNGQDHSPQRIFLAWRKVVELRKQRAMNRSERPGEGP